MNIVAIDPGYAARGPGCAVAVFTNKLLVHACFTRPGPGALKALGLSTTDVVVWECPQVDSRTRAAVPAAVQLAAVGGTLAGQIAGATGCMTIVPVAPSTWKGSARKPQAHARLWQELVASERAILGGPTTADRIEEAKRAGALDRWRKPGGSYYRATWHMHNILDAVGIGYWYLDKGCK